MIEVERLTKDYGTVVAVRDLSFQVPSGQVVGFVGPNGAGKSTTLRILAGFLGATSGKVRVAGHDVAMEPLAAKRSLGYLPETSPLYPELRVREYLLCRAQLKQVPRRQRRVAVDRALALSATEDVAETLILHLSRGYRQRVGLADSLIGNPPLLILDEPTAGLDPNQIREVRNLIRELGRQHTILLSTHILSEVESTCDRAIVIDRGQLVAQGSLQELRALRRARSATLVVNDPEQRAGQILEGLPGVSEVTTCVRDGSSEPPARDGPAEEPPGGSSEETIEGRAIDAWRSGPPDRTPRFRELHLGFAADCADCGTLLERAVATLVSQGVGVREVRPARARLEDIFAQLTQTITTRLEDTRELTSP